MARQFQTKDPHWGTQSFFVIHSYDDGTWESEWDVFRTDLKTIGSLFSQVSFDAYQDCLRKHALPLLRELGPGPVACLLKMTSPYITCAHRSQCSMYDKKQCVGNQSPPTCFESEVSEKEREACPEAGTLIARVFDLWRQGFHIIVAPYSDK
jgi:hypothetical protein